MNDLLETLENIKVLKHQLNTNPNIHVYAQYISSLQAYITRDILPQPFLDDFKIYQKSESFGEAYEKITNHVNTITSYGQGIKEQMESAPVNWNTVSSKSTFTGGIDYIPQTTISSSFGTDLNEVMPEYFTNKSYPQTLNQVHKNAEKRFSKPQIGTRIENGLEFDDEVFK